MFYSCEILLYIEKDQGHNLTGGLWMTKRLKVIYSKRPIFHDWNTVNDDKGKTFVFDEVKNCINSWSNKKGKLDGDLAEEIFPKNYHFLSTDTHTFVCALGGKKC